jgi:hypothetical protein
MTNETRTPVAPCPRCDVGDLYAAPDGTIPPACEACTAEKDQRADA